MKDTGRKIKRVTMPSYGPSGEQSIYFITPGKGPRDSLEWETINYGDHGDPYIVSYKDGIEVERINPRFVISVELEIPEPTTTEEEA
jgi:hypothetical protein